MLRLEQKSEETIRTYRKAVKKFLEFLAVNKLPLDGTSVLPFVAFMNDTAKKAKPSTIKLYMIALKRYFDFLKAQGIADVTWPKMKYPTVNRSRPKFLDKDEFQELYDFTAGDLQLRAMISTTYSTAMRVSEICNSRVQDYDLDAVVDKAPAPRMDVSGKTPEDTDATLPLTDTAVKDIKAYLKDAKARTGYSPGPNDYMFFRPDDVKRNVSPRQMNERLYNVCRKMGVRQVSWHWIRHSRATHLRQDDVRMEDIQDLLRHRSPATTAIYASTDTEKLRRKVNRNDILGAKREKVI